MKSEGIKKAVDILTYLCLNQLNMRISRTTLRIKTDLKKAAQRRAIHENTTLQDIFNIALDEYLKREDRKKARKLVFKTHDLGVPLDNLTRDDFYDSP